MSEFEPDYDALWRAPYINTEDRMVDVVAELRRQEREAGWVLVRREDAHRLAAVVRDVRDGLAIVDEETIGAVVSRVLDVTYAAAMAQDR